MRNFYSVIKPVFLLVLLFGSAELWAQTRITGRVTSGDDGSSLPGVSILEKGTTNGTVSDANGGYAISVSPNAVLVFSFVGYATQEVAASGRTTVDVSLASDVTALGEIVIVGYGQQEKKDVTGVVAAVSSETFNKGAIVAPEQLITGKVAGVNVSQPSGEPGVGINIRVRGGTSITAGNEPLFVIDGIPVDNAGYPGARNPLNFLNPNDIETFTVLKDASAAAIYGSRAANGVVIITTKKGKAGTKPVINYDGFYSVARIAKRQEFLNADQYRDVVAFYNPSKLAILGNANTDWQDEIMRTAKGQSHNLSFSSGSENTAYRASVGYLDQEGIIRNSGTKRTNFGFNINQKMFDQKLSIDANVKVSETQDQFNGGGIGVALSMAPTQPVFDANSPYGGYFEWASPLGTKNPVAEVDLTQNRGRAHRGMGNIQLDYKFDDLLPGLRANMNLGADVIRSQRRFFQPTYLRAQSTQSAPGQVEIEDINRVNKLMEFYLNYTKALESIDSKIDVTAGYSWQEFVGFRSRLVARGLNTNVYGSNNPAVGEPERTTVEADPQENALISFFGRANLSIKDRYLLTVNLRRDGSSRFGEENRWGLFPSAAVGWRVYEEEFFAGLRNTFSDLKFRVGYGVTGSQEFGNYRFTSVYGSTNGFAEYPFGDRYVSPIRPSAVDPNLKWEQTSSLNIGLDFGLLGGRLTGSIEYYEKNTNDLLFEVNLPAGMVAGDRWITNIGKVKNSGVELTLDAAVIDKQDFRWNLNFNIATNKNEIVSLDGSDRPDFAGYETGGIAGGTGNNIQVLKVGNPVNSFRVFRSLKDAEGNIRRDGVDYNEDGTIGLADMYADVNGDGIVNDQDREIVGSPNPKVLAGLTSSLYYKNFDLSFTLRANLGQYVYNNVSSATGFYNRINDQVPQNLPSSVLETQFRAIQLFSDYYLEKASFVRMDNISIGYTFKQLSGANIRLYGTVQNPFVITKYKGIDPEAGVSGIDNNLYPRSRTFLVGLNIGF